ncbi:MAG: L-threonylcarbamoyladenylate synthase [Thermodesulfovibrionales bacterium]
MMILKLTGDNPEELIDKAVAIINGGGIVAFPTETFYGLGVRFDSPDSLRRLYEIKRRPREKAMPLIIGDTSQLNFLVDPVWLKELPVEVKGLMERYWPGPLTLLMPARSGLSEFLIGYNKTIAIRIPGESFALHLAKKAGFPITATSANISGMPPADDAERVIEYFDYSLDLLIDGGRTPGGLPSTIVDVTGERLKIVRKGAVKIEV